MTLVITAPQAVELNTLLQQVDTRGLSWQILGQEARPMPVIRGIGSLAEASHEEIGFLANPKFFSLLATTQAGAVILPQRAIDALAETALTLHSSLATPFTVIQCEEPYLLYARLSQWFDNFRLSTTQRVIDAHAVVHDSAKLGKNVSIGPLAVIGANADIGDNVIIGAGAVIGEGVKIGANSHIYANVTLYHDIDVGERCIIHSGSVIGADGFGFAPDNTQEQGAWCKISQLGRVLIGDDVEIGACTTVDRGALNDTIIGRGVKLDNQIMIGHNCQIGEHTAMAACVGVAGSSTVGKRCTIAGAGMLSGHVTLGDDIHISGASGVISDITKPGRYTGMWPIAEHSEWQKNAAALSSLYELRRRVQSLEKTLAKLSDVSE